MLSLICFTKKLIMKTFYTTILLTLFVFLSSFIDAQNQAPEIEWQRTYGGSDDDKGVSSDKTNDGGLIIAGLSYSNDGDITFNNGLSDYWIVKLDDLGNLEWEKSYGGSLIDEATFVQQTNDRGFIVAGNTSSNNGNILGFHGDIDYWLIKLDSLGDLEWQRALGGSVNDEAKSIRQTNDGGYIVAGMSNSNDGDVTGNQGDYDCWIVKIDSSGNIEWEKSFGGSSYDSANSIEQTNDGGYIVAGQTLSNDGDVSTNNGSYDFWVLKLNNLGVIEWEKSFGGSSYDIPYSIQQVNDLGFIVGGVTESNDGDVLSNNGYEDCWILKLTNTGVLEWQKTFGGSDEEKVKSIKQTNDGGYIVSATSKSNDGDLTSNNGYIDFWIVKLDVLGGIEWQKSLGGSNSDEVFNVQIMDDDSYTLTGITTSNDGDILGNNGGGDYWIVKVNFPKSFINGEIFQDINNNCLNDNNERKINKSLIRQTQPSQLIFETDSLGRYNIPVFDTITYTFKSIVPEYLNPLILNICDSSFSVKIDSIGQDTNGFDFGFEMEPCPLLLVDITSNRRRSCFTSTTTISYRNDGVADENNVEIIVELPDSVYIVSTSYPYTINTLGQLIFNIDSLAAQESGIITIVDSMACELTLAGTQACTKAWITPANTCYNNIVNTTPWDSSNIVVNGGIQVDSLGDSCYLFVIKNIGEQMQDSSAYNIYSGTGFIQSDSFLIGPNDSIVIEVCGVDYAQVLVNQHPSNPITKSVFFAPPTTDTTIVNVYEFINVAENLESAIECLTVVNAYDPNDKNATPSGWGDENFVSTNTLLDYKIRFQNTGNDTAYNIEVIDTIDATVFDISRLILGGSSHPYTFEVNGDSGQVVFHFLFDNINLLDSFNNEPLSHGFVNFKIGAYDNIPEGTVANNFADIYFDFNPAIRTNTSMVTLQDTVPVENNNGITIRVLEQIEDTTGIKDLIKSNINIYPNPANNQVHVTIDDNDVLSKNYDLKLYDVTGKLIINQVLNTKESIINLNQIENGIYIIQISTKDNLHFNSKLVVNR